MEPAENGHETISVQQEEEGRIRDENDLEHDLPIGNAESHVQTTDDGYRENLVAESCSRQSVLMPLHE